MPRKFSDFPAIKQIDFRGEFCFICSTLVQNVYRDGRYLYFLIILVNSTELILISSKLMLMMLFWVLQRLRRTPPLLFLLSRRKSFILCPSPLPTLPLCLRRSLHPSKLRFHRPPFLQPLQPLSEHVTLVVLGSKCTKSSMQSCGTGRRIRLAGQLDFGVLFLKGMKRE